MRGKGRAYGVVNQLMFKHLLNSEQAAMMGGFMKCGRSGGEKRKNYPKGVPIAKARAMSKGFKRAGAVKENKRKRIPGPTKGDLLAATCCKEKEKRHKRR